MLHEFLFAERKNILALCQAKLLRLSDEKTSSDEMDLGLPVFYDELIEILRADQEDLNETIMDKISVRVHHEAAVRRGKESLRLGYTISQVVHGYGALCQAITEYATENSHVPIMAREFNRLNFCLDTAIAEAVTEYNRVQNISTAREEVQRLGYLAHEIRNALANASTAHQMIMKGIVGFNGSTNKVLEDSLSRMKNIIDRSLSEVRLRGEPSVDCQRCRLVDLVGEVEATSMAEARAKSIQLHVFVDPNLEILADRHLVLSAISNVVQNAIKFTIAGGNVWIRGTAVADTVLIEVEDQCGGLPDGQIEKLFQPFSQKGVNRTGLGLGLSISRRAIALNNGHITAQDIPSKGCVFKISLPLAPARTDPLDEIPATPCDVQQ